MKLDWQWPAAFVYGITFVGLTLLVYAGKFHPEVMLSMLTWLAPGPWQKTNQSGGSITQTTTTEVVAPALETEKK